MMSISCFRRQIMISSHKMVSSRERWLERTYTDSLGYMNGGKLQYQDASGFNLDHQVLVFKVTLPKGSKPLVA